MKKEKIFHSLLPAILQIAAVCVYISNYMHTYRWEMCVCVTEEAVWMCERKIWRDLDIKVAFSSLILMVKVTHHLHLYLYLPPFFFYISSSLISRKKKRRKFCPFSQSNTAPSLPHCSFSFPFFIKCFLYFLFYPFLSLFIAVEWHWEAPEVNEVVEAYQE